MKFCKDCKFISYHADIVQSECTHEKNLIKSRSYPIDGSMFSPTCLVAREAHKPCGPAGTLWQANIFYNTSVTAGAPD